MKVAELWAGLGIRPDQRSFAKAGRKLHKFSQTAERAAAGIGKALTSRLGALVAGAGLVAGGRDAHAFSTGLVRLQTASKGALGSLAEMQTKILGVSDATGIAKEQVTQGTASFISLTGDAKTAAGAMGVFARVSQATGSDIDDVARSGAALSQSMGIAGEDFEKAFSILIASGKAGSVELKDVSQVMAKLTATSSQFAGGTGIKALADTSAALQLVTRGFGGQASEGANALDKLMGAMVGAAPKLKKFGVNVFTIDKATGQKVRRNFQDIVEDINNSKLTLDPTKLKETLGSKEALKAYEQLTKTTGEWRNLSKTTEGANDAVTDYAKVSRTSAIKVTKAWNKFKNSVTRVFATVIDVLGVLVEHGDMVVTVLGAIGVAFLYMGRKAVTAGLRTAAAWAVANAAMLLMPLLIAVLVLAIQDFISFLQGKDSIIGRLFGENADQWRKDITEFLSWFYKKIKTAVYWADDLTSALTGKESMRERENRQMSETVVKKSTRFGADGKMVDPAEAMRFRKGVEATLKAIVPTRKPEVQPYRWDPNAMGIPGTNVNITINEATNAQDTGREVQDAITRSIKANTPR